MAVHPLRPATYHRLGEPLPHQLTNRTQSSLMASLFINLSCNQLIISSLISRFQLLSQSIRQVLYALLTRPPWLHQCKHSLHHRLACVKHSVSVHPEPGSNSSFNLYSSPFCLLFIDEKITYNLPFHIFLGLLFFLLFCYLLSSSTFSIDKMYSNISHHLCQLLFLKFI